VFAAAVTALLLTAVDIGGRSGLVAQAPWEHLSPRAVLAGGILLVSGATCLLFGAFLAVADGNQLGAAHPPPLPRGNENTEPPSLVP